MRYLGNTTKILVLLVLVLFPLLGFAQTDSSAFVPLTNLPGIEQAANSQTLPIFLNNLYKLCIGAAAVIAILQIMRAGAYLMFNKGSLAHNEQAKSLISNSILGLLLVLSPAIIFAIINPDILNLKLDLSRIKPDALQSINLPGGASALGPISVIARQTGNGQISIPGDIMSMEDKANASALQSRCLQTHGEIRESGRVSAECPSGTTSSTGCVRTSIRCEAGTPDAPEPTSCSVDYESISAAPGGTCPAGQTSINRSSGCCSGITTGSTCCGKPRQGTLENPTAAQCQYQYQPITAATAGQQCNNLPQYQSNPVLQSNMSQIPSSCCPTVTAGGKCCGARIPGT